MFYVEFELSMSISPSLYLLVSVSFRVHAGKLGQVTNFRPTIGGDSSLGGML